MLVIFERIWNTLSFSGNVVIPNAFLLRRFFYLSLTHDAIFHQSMLQILWMQRNIWCIILATFKMIAMRSARFASVLSMFKSTNYSDSSHTSPASCELSPYVISRPLQAKLPKLPVNSTDVQTTSMSAYTSSVSNPQSSISWYTNVATFFENGLQVENHYACFIM